MTKSKWDVNKDLFISFLRTGLLGYGEVHQRSH